MKQESVSNEGACATARHDRPADLLWLFLWNPKNRAKIKEFLKATTTVSNHEMVPANHNITPGISPVKTKAIMI